MLYFCVYKFVGKIAKMTIDPEEAAKWLTENEYGEVFGVEGAQFVAVESMIVNRPSTLQKV